MVASPLIAMIGELLKRGEKRPRLPPRPRSAAALHRHGGLRLFPPFQCAYAVGDLQVRHPPKPDWQAEPALCQGNDAAVLAALSFRSTRRLKVLVALRKGTTTAQPDRRLPSSSAASASTDATRPAPCRHWPLSIPPACERLKPLPGAAAALSQRWHADCFR